jgi:Tol biopolymer transport system component
VSAIANNAYFAFSPDGVRVAVMDPAAPVTEPAPLIVHDLASGEERVVHERASAFFWSPSGDHLAVYSVVRDAALTPLAAAPARRNAPLAQSRDAALRIEIVDAATGAAVRVADTFPSRQFVQYLQFFDQYSRAVSPWSPDGRHLVFSSLFPERGAADVAVASLNDARSAVDVRRIAAGTIAFWSPR